MPLRLLPCLLAAALALPMAATAADAVPGPSDYAAAKALADRDEAALPAALAERLQTLQRAALDEGVASCATPRPDTSPFTIVVALDAQGAVSGSWHSGGTSLAICMEKFLRTRPLPAPHKVPLFLSYELRFTP